MSIPGFSYDTLDRLIEEIGFDGRTQRYQYNEAGELIAREDANGQTNVHDESHRVSWRPFRLSQTETA